MINRYDVTGVGLPTDLRVGETSVTLKADPYYGSVDTGAGSGDLGEWLSDVQDAIDHGWRALDSEIQNRIEVLTGVRLQQLPAPPRPDLPDRPDPPDRPDHAPVLTLLAPTNAVLGTPSFTLSVIGVGFADGDVIVWNGGDEPTTFVSDTELTTGVNMETAQVAMPIPIQVRGAGGVSNTLTFTLLESPARGVPAGRHTPKS